MELVTLAKVKALIDLVQDDTEHDAVLNDIIEAVSTQAEKYLNRVVQTAQQADERFDVNGGDMVFKLRAVPVVSIDDTGEGVWNDPTWSFSTEVDTTLYSVDSTAGLLYIRTSLTVGFRALKVCYTGGMAETTEKLIATYPDLAHAAARQVLYLFNTRRQIGAESVQVGDSSVYWRGDFAWMPGVKEVLDSYRRR